MCELPVGTELFIVIIYQSRSQNLFLLVNRDAVTSGSVLASSAQPPASATNFCSCHLCCEILLLRRKDTRRKDRVTYGGSTLPKNRYSNVTFTIYDLRFSTHKGKSVPNNKERFESRNFFIHE
jgi:hypothetical protein